MPTCAPDERRFGATRRVVEEMGAFAVVGACCFALDLALFQILYVHLDMGAVAAKLISTLTSMTAAFVGHRFWSFSRRARTGLRREYLRFAGINGVTLLLGLAIIWFVRYPLGQEGVLVLQAANVFAICVGTVVRFVAYSHWVFPGDAPSAEEPAAQEPAGVAHAGPEPDPRPVTSPG